MAFTRGVIEKDTDTGEEGSLLLEGRRFTPRHPCDLSVMTSARTVARGYAIDIPGTQLPTGNTVCYGHLFFHAVYTPFQEHLAEGNINTYPYVFRNNSLQNASQNEPQISDLQSQSAVL